MSVVPELRETLVKAATRQAAPQPRIRWRLPSAAAFAMTFATVTALAVAGVLLVLAGHRPGRPAPAPASLQGRAEALAVAERAAAQFTPPAGAIAVSADPSSQHRLGHPNAALPDPTAADVARFWLVRGGVQDVVTAIGKRGGSSGTMIESSSSGEATSAAPGGADGTSVVTYASSTFDLLPVGSVNRQIQVSAAPARHGLTAVRLDAIAWWLPPRPAWAQVPPLTTVITIDVLGHVSGGPRLKASRAIYDEPQLGQVLHVLNSLPRATASTLCNLRDGLALRLTFGPLGAAARRPTTALVEPACGLVTVSTPGHPPVRLAFTAPVAHVSVSELARFLGTLEAATFQLRMAPGSGSASGSSSTQTMTATASSSTPSP